MAELAFDDGTARRAARAAARAEGFAAWRLSAPAVLLLAVLILAPTLAVLGFSLTDYELGYDGFTKFDHDFIGGDALKAMQGKNTRKKVTFAWNNADVEKIFASQLAPEGQNYKFIDLPLSNYASSSFDAVMSGGKTIGASMFSGYSFNARKMLSLGFVEEQFAKVGTELTLVWGEENGGTRKTTVERHKQTEINVVVGPTPYGQQARETYHSGWRTAAAG